MVGRPPLRRRDRFNHNRPSGHATFAATSCFQFHAYFVLTPILAFAFVVLPLVKNTYVASTTFLLDRLCV